MFIVWPSVPGLLVARFVSGISVGPAHRDRPTAHITNCTRPPARTPSPDPGRRGGHGREPRGIGLGPLIAGLLAQYVPIPVGWCLPHLSWRCW